MHFACGSIPTHIRHTALHYVSMYVMFKEIRVTLPSACQVVDEVALVEVPLLGELALVFEVALLAEVTLVTLVVARPPSRCLFGHDVDGATGVGGAGATSLTCWYWGAC